MTLRVLPLRNQKISQFNFSAHCPSLQKLRKVLVKFKVPFKLVAIWQLTALSYPLLVMQSIESFCLLSLMLKIKIDFEQDLYVRYFAVVGFQSLMST